MIALCITHHPNNLTQPLSKAQASLPTYCTSQTFSWSIFLGWYLTRDATLPVAGCQGNQSLASLAQGGQAGGPGFPISYARREKLVELLWLHKDGDFPPFIV